MLNLQVVQLHRGPREAPGQEVENRLGGERKETAQIEVRPHVPASRPADQTSK